MVNADFSSGYNSVTVQGLTQWDKGQVLAIRGLDLDATVQVHFVNKFTDKAIVFIAYKQDGGESTVDIPNSLLEVSADINAYIYVTDGAAGKTVKTIKIPVTARTKPADFISEPDPTEAEILDELLAYCNALEIKVDDYTAIVEKFRNETVQILSVEEYNALAKAGKVENGILYCIKTKDTLAALTAEVARQVNEGFNNGTISAAAATGAPDLGEITDDDTEETANNARAFSFRNTNGFGSRTEGSLGVLKVWDLEDTNDGNVYCSLVPSLDGKQNLGYGERRYREVHAKTIYGGGVYKYNNVYGANSITLPAGLYDIAVDVQSGIDDLIIPVLRGLVSVDRKGGYTILYHSGEKYIYVYVENIDRYNCSVSAYSNGVAGVLITHARLIMGYNEVMI